MTENDLRIKCDQLSWWHSIELAPGITTKGVKTPEILAHEARLIFDPIKMTGVSVLDIGAWNGFFSFEAKKRGARRVLACDDLTWTHPTIRGKDGFDLARSSLGLDIEDLRIDVLDIGPSLGKFEVVLFLGVFYHLLDPIKAMQNIRDLQPRCLIVETCQDALQLDRPAMVFYPGDTLGGDASNWWGPNRLLMYHLLTELGFKTIMYSENVVNHQRGVYHAFLEEDDFFALADPQAQAVWSDLRLVIDSESSNPSAEKRDEDLKSELIALRADVGELKRELKVLRRSSWSWQLGKPIRRMRAKAGSAKPPPVGKYGGACPRSLWSNCECGSLRSGSR